MLVFAGTPTICRRKDFKEPLKSLWRIARTRGQPAHHVSREGHPARPHAVCPCREGNADLSETDRSPFIVLAGCNDVPPPGRSGFDCSHGVRGLRTGRRTACAEVAVDRVAAPTGGCVGRGRRIQRVDLPAYATGELAACAGRPNQLPLRFCHLLLVAGSVSR